MGTKGCLAARWIFRMSLHTYKTYKTVSDQWQESRAAHGIVVTIILLWKMLFLTGLASIYSLNERMQKESILAVLWWLGGQSVFLAISHKEILQLNC